MLAIQKILCPVDFSEPAHRALLKAIALVSHDAAEFIVLHVLPHTSSGTTPNDAASAQLQPTDVAEALKNIDELIRDFLPDQVSARAMVQQGDITSEILRVAVDESVDLIVMATHGATGWREFVLGSVADEIVRLAPCPVLTIGEAALNSMGVDVATGIAHQAINSNQNQAETNCVQVKAEHEVAPAHDALPYYQPESDFPVAGSPEAKLRFLLGYAVLAPSNRNSQPWLWKIAENAVELYADRMRALPHLDPEDRELIISCGAALQHLRVAMRHFGYEPHVQAFPDPNDPDLLARIVLGEELPTANDKNDLFDELFRRHTNRMPFLEREIPALLLSQLQTEAEKEGAMLVVIEKPEMRMALIELIAQGDHIQGHDAQFLQETMRWIHPSRDARDDGIPEHALGGGGLVSHYNQNLSEAQADKDRLLAWSAPVFSVLMTEGDTPKDWLVAGQALARVLLWASAYGVQASFFNSPVEVVELWPKLHHILGCGRLPQMLLRLGYPSQQAGATPRRVVDEVVQ